MRVLLLGAILSSKIFPVVRWRGLLRNSELPKIQSSAESIGKIGKQHKLQDARKRVGQTASGVHLQFALPAQTILYLKMPS